MLHDVINLEKGIIILNLKKVDMNGKAVGPAQRVGYSVEPKKLLKILTSLAKSGGRRTLERLIFSANDGGLVIATSKGHQMFPGNAKEIISGFLASIGKPTKPVVDEKMDTEEKSVAEVKKTVRKKITKGILAKKPKSE